MISVLVFVLDSVQGVRPMVSVKVSSCEMSVSSDLDSRRWLSLGCACSASSGNVARECF